MHERGLPRRTRNWLLWRQVITLLALVTGGGGGCGDDNVSGCPDGYEREGDRCLLTFHDCPSPAEIPIPGGGCRAVGVPHCAAGLFEADGAGGCEPILPTGECPEGTREVLGRRDCLPVGITTCSDGFVTDGAGGCEPVLPASTCGFASIEALGQVDCLAIRECGDATWGNIAGDAETVHVAADYTGALSDGSAGAPFTTISEALDVVQPGGKLAVAAGEYAEYLVLDQEVRLEGRCPDLVTIRGVMRLGQDRPAITVTALATGSTIRGVTLTGPDSGLRVDAATLTLEEVQVVDTGSFGIDIWDRADVTLRRVRVAGTRHTGVVSLGSDVRIEDSVIRDTQPQSGADYSRGIDAMCAPGGLPCSHVRVTRTLVSGVTEQGIRSSGADTVIEASVVLDTLPHPNGDRGHGIEAICRSASECGSLQVSDSYIHGSRSIGLIVTGPQATIRRTVVRDTQARAYDRKNGFGLWVGCGMSDGVCTSAEVTDSAVVANRHVGIMVDGGNVVLDGCIVRDTIGRDLDGQFGNGIDARCDRAWGVCATLEVRDSLITRNSESGLVSFGADVILRGTVLRGNRSDAYGYFGRGISAQCFPNLDACGSLEVTECLITGNQDSGIYVGGPPARVTGSVIQDNLPRDLDQALGHGLDAGCSYSDGLCSSVDLVDTVVRRNRECGLLLIGADATLIRVVVADTLPSALGYRGGRGVEIQCDERTAVCPLLEVFDSQIRGNQNVGLLALGATVALDGLLVTDTRPNAEGAWANDYGYGVYLMCDDRVTHCGTAAVTGSRIDQSHGAGLAVEGVSGLVEASAILGVVPRPLDDKYGYGLQVKGLAGAPPVTFHLGRSVIQGAELAGVVYLHSAGLVTENRIAGGVFSVVMNVGSSPVVADNNRLSGSFQDAPIWSNVEPAPAPPPSMPAGFD